MTMARACQVGRSIAVLTIRSWNSEF